MTLKTIILLACTAATISACVVAPGRGGYYGGGYHGGYPGWRHY